MAISTQSPIKTQVRRIEGLSRLSETCLSQPMARVSVPRFSEHARPIPHDLTTFRNTGEAQFHGYNV
jgi:hypothetical protein